MLSSYLHRASMITKDFIIHLMHNIYYVDTIQKRLESFEMWCWRRMEKISWTDHVRNEEVLLTVN